MLLFRALIPSAKHMGFVTGDVDTLRFTKKNIIALIVLVIVGAIAVFGYSVYSYNTTSLSASYTSQERYERNTSMVAPVLENNPQLEGQEVVTIIESAIPKFGNPNVTYSVAVYTVNQEQLDANIAAKLEENPDSTYGLDTLKGYSKSKAKADDSLTSVGYATIVLDKGTGAVVSYEDDFE